MQFGDNVIKKTIKDTEYQLYLLPAEDGIVIAQKLSQLVLPLLSASDGKEGEFSFDFAKLATALSMGISDKELLTIIKRLLKEATANGKQIEFNSYFRANYGTLVALLAFSLKENFGSFFEGLAMLED